MQQCLTLRDLKLTKIINKELVLSLKAITTHPFHRLFELHCNAEAIAFARLSPHLSVLHTLGLVLVGSTSNALSSISPCINLQALSFEYPSGSAIIPNELVSLAESCRGLRVLSLQGYPLKAPDLTDEHVQHVAYLLPQLQVLRLLLRLQLSISALIYLGKHCRQMTYCNVGGSFDLVALDEESECLFPLLRSLNVRKMVHEVHTTVEHVAAVVHRHMPLLICFLAKVRSDFDKAVLEAVRGMRAAEHST